MLGQAIMIIYKAVGVPDDMAKSLVPVTLIFLAALFTGIGIFDNLAKIAGAGTLVPITGFANAVVSPAIDNKSAENVTTEEIITQILNNVEVP